jgi:hypothetical protein
MVVAAALVAVAGCKGSEDGSAGASANAFTAASPAPNTFWDDLVGSDSKTYKSGGAASCGHVLTLTRGPQPGRGTYDYTFIDGCDAEGGGVVAQRSRGDFSVITLGITALTNPTLQIRPSNPNEEGWTYQILRAGEGEDLPAGTLSLESNSDHHAHLIPEGFIN